jgi:hypothetical protein
MSVTRSFALDEDVSRAIDIHTERTGAGLDRAVNDALRFVLQGTLSTMAAEAHLQRHQGLKGSGGTEQA